MLHAIRYTCSILHKTPTCVSYFVLWAVLAMRHMVCLTSCAGGIVHDVPGMCTTRVMFHMLHVHIEYIIYGVSYGRYHMYRVWHVLCIDGSGLEDMVHIAWRMLDVMWYMWWAMRYMYVRLWFDTCLRVPTMYVVGFSMRCAANRMHHICNSLVACHKTFDAYEYLVYGAPFAYVYVYTGIGRCMCICGCI